MIDFIGDIHGYADKLEWLLAKLGYEKKGKVYRHSERQVVFIGDYIDRGPDNLRVINIVKGMVDAGSAIALMGNHEYNAVLFNTLGKKGYLRPHLIKNIKQHHATLLQYQGKQDDYNEMIEWFRTLPLYYETDIWRACHACWDKDAISYLNKQTKNTGVLSAKQFVQSSKKGNKLYEAVEATCKGLEVELPKGISFFDKDGTERFDIRVKWWENPKGKTYKQMSVIQTIKMKKQDFKMKMNHYKAKEKPVFFGHYWLGGLPKLLSSNACCLDFSVAKDGYLVAYRFDGEQVLDEGKFVFV